MENEVRTVDGSVLGGKEVVGNEVVESKVEKKMVEYTAEAKDSEGDDVFEEASTETPQVDWGNSGKNVKLGDSLKVDGNLDAGGDLLEKFEEAIEVPVEVQNHEVKPLTVVQEKVEEFVDKNDVDEVKVIGTIGEHSVVPEEIVRHKVILLENKRLVGSPEDEVKEFVDKKDVDEVKVTGIIDEHSVPEENVRDEVILLENNGLGDSLKDEVKVVHDLGTEDEIVSKDGAEVNEKTAVVIDKSQNGVPFSGNLNLDGSVVKDILDSGLDNNEAGGGARDSQWQASESNGEILHQIDKNLGLNETFGVSGNGTQDEKDGDIHDVSDGLHSDQQAGELDESSNLSAAGETVSETGIVVKRMESPVKDSSTIVESNPHEESCKLNYNLHTSVEDTPEVGRSLFPEVSTGKKYDKLEGVASDVVAETSKNSQPHREKVSADVAAKLEKQTTKLEVVKQSSENIRESEVRPAPHVSSSIKSAAPAPASTPAPASRPAGLGRAAPLLESSPRVVQHPRVNGSVSQAQNQLVEDPTNGEAEENDETCEKLQMIRVKFLRLARRLGQTPHNVVVAQVLYRLGLAEQLRGGNGGRVAAFSFDRASAMAEQLEAAGQEPLDFSCTIMVLGKTGVGKSATINSIFDQVKFGTDAFDFGTKKVQDVVGTVQGIKVRVIDTPGLLPSSSDQHRNEKILQSVKRFIKKSPPDIVLYLDRLDMQSRDFGDMPLLRTITDTFGPSIWFNAIVVLTHAASAPPEGPNGVATSYEMFVTQRSHVVQQAIRQAAGDMRLMNPVSLVENHSACRTNRAGQRVLPNGQVWKPHLLLLSFASKILAEANTLLKLQDGPPGKPFAARARGPPLPFLLTSLLRPRPQLKLPHEQYGGDDDDTLDDDLDESMDSDDESEYDELPPFKSLTKAQLAQLPKDQKKAYYEELEYREKLYMKKQLKEEKQRRRAMKKMAAAANELPSDYSEGVDEESGGASSVPVPMADLPLPASFDSDNPTHRYRCLDTTNQWLVRPVLDSHSWDHDVGYEGVNMERSFVVKEKIPMSFSGQVTKDKKEAHFQMEVAGSIKHNKGKSTTLGFDMQQLGKDIAYTIRSDTRFSNYRQNKGTASFSVTHMGDSVTAGAKVEDKLIVGKRGQVVMSGGAIVGRGDVAYGGSLEAMLRDKDYPLGRSLTTMSLSVMDWHGDLATGWNAQTQLPIGRFTNLIGSVNINNRGQGQVSIRLNSSEQLQIALVALIPLLRKVFSQPGQ